MEFIHLYKRYVNDLFCYPSHELNTLHFTLTLRQYYNIRRDSQSNTGPPIVARHENTVQAEQDIHNPDNVVPPSSPILNRHKPHPENPSIERALQKLSQQQPWLDKTLWSKEM